MSAPVKAGDRIRRLDDGRRFRVTFVNMKCLNVRGVFTAVSDDGQWSSWGGPVEQLVESETFVLEVPGE